MTVQIFELTEEQAQHLMKLAENENKKDLLLRLFWDVILGAHHCMHMQCPQRAMNLLCMLVVIEELPDDKREAALTKLSDELNHIASERMCYDCQGSA